MRKKHSLVRASSMSRRRHSTRISCGKAPFDIPNILDSLKRDYEAGRITLEEAAKELYDANWTNSIDLKKTKRLLGIESAVKCSTRRRRTIRASADDMLWQDGKWSIYRDGDEIVISDGWMTDYASFDPDGTVRVAGYTPEMRVPKHVEKKLQSLARNGRITRPQKWYDDVDSSKSVRCSSRPRHSIRAAAESGVMIKTETAEGTYYLAKSATKKKTFWTEKFDSANKFAKKDSALNKLYTVLTRLEENAFYDPDDMYDIETEADLKKAKFAKFYITDLSGKTIEDISSEVKNHMLSVDSFVSVVLDDFDDEDDIEESTIIRGRRTIRASVGDDVYADDIQDVIRNAGIKVLDVKKSGIHNSDSFFSILLDNTNDFNAVVDAITDAGYGVTYDYPAVDGNWMYVMISDNREDDAFLYRVVYGYQSEVVPMNDETSDYQAVLDECIDMKEARGDKDIYTMDEVEAEGWNEDEYVIGGNHGLALYTGGNFNIEPIGYGKPSEYVRSTTRISAARDTTVDKDAVRELVLYITNDASLYPQVQAIVKNMKQKIKRGKYDDELAVKAWQYLADAGVAKYDKEFGSGGGTKAMLNKATREQIARELRDEYADMVNEDVEASEGLVTM